MGTAEAPTRASAGAATAPQRRDFSLDIRADADPASREVSGTAVTFDTRNSYWEVFVPGAFADSLANKSDRKPLVMGYGHTDPIGRWRDFGERFDDEVKGLEVAGAVSETTLGNDALTLVRDGALTGLSIGFFSIREEYAEPGQEATFKTEFGDVTYRFDESTFYVTEADVVEASIVMAPSDDEARLNSRRAALRCLPDPDASEADIREAIRHVALDDELALVPAERRAIVERLTPKLVDATDEAAVSGVLSGPGSVYIFPATSTAAASGPPERREIIEPTSALATALADALDDDDERDDVLAALAEGTGLSDDEVSTILDGEGEPTRDELAAFADVLGLDADDLVAAAEADGVTFDESENGDDEATNAALAELRESVDSLAEKIRPTDSLHSSTDE